MTPTSGRGQTRLLTGFLVLAAMTVVVAIVLGPALRSSGDGTDVVRVGAPVITTTTVPTPTSVAPTTTTVAPPTTTTTTTTVAPLVVLDTEDVAAVVAPKVAFVSTFLGTGSGVLIDDNLMITNAHVVWPFRDIGVLFPGDTRRNGRVIGVDPRGDIALVEVESPKLPEPVAFGTTEELDRGSDVFVVGYPAVESLVPDVTIVESTYAETLMWEFSGVSWTVAETAAVGGQSGGGLFDEFGRLVGMTTFGSRTQLYSVTIEDLEDRIEELRDDAQDTVTERLPPRAGARLNHSFSLNGPWEQAAFVTWLVDGAESRLTSTGGVEWRALDAFGLELGVGATELNVRWPVAIPGVLLAETTVDGVVAVDVEMDRPIIVLPDPDDGQQLAASSTEVIVGGFIDVPGDKDWFFVDLDEATETFGVVVQAQTRVRISMYDRSNGQLIAEVDHERGFLFDDPALDVGALDAGSYVITVEDIAHQFGTYSLEVNR